MIYQLWEPSTVMIANFIKKTWSSSKLVENTLTVKTNEELLARFWKKAFDLKLKGEELQATTYTKDLGLTVCNNLNYDEHIKVVQLKKA